MRWHLGYRVGMLCFVAWAMAVSDVNAQWRRYRNPVCNSPSCTMCNTIRARNARQATFSKPTVQYQPVQQYSLPAVTTSPPAVPVRSVSPAPSRAAGVTAATPKSVEDKFGPTRHEAIPALLPLLELDSDDLLIDPGCGDARILVAASRAYGCRGRGYEIQPDVAELARQRVAEAGLSDLIEIIDGDSRELADFTGCTVYCYLFSETLEPMAAKLRGAERVVSYLHEVPGLPTTTTDLTISGKRHRVYVYDPHHEYDEEHLIGD